MSPACTRSLFPQVRKADNFDKTGIRLVRKGVTVADGALRGKVLKVKQGSCIVDWAGGRKKSPEWCRTVTVLDV